MVFYTVCMTHCALAMVHNFKSIHFKSNLLAISNQLIQFNWKIATVEAEFGRAKKQQALWQQVNTLAPEFNRSQLQNMGIKPSQLKPFLDKLWPTTSYPK